ncbi:hypothetical protein JCM8097_008791 [Rhodosporidiobolus ruineniae]
MANRESDLDPFAARGTNTVPPGQFEEDLQAAPARAATAGTAGAASTAAGGAATASSAANPRSAPLLSRTSATRTGTSGKSVKTPWYLTWLGIALLIAALLIALGLGVGLGVGLGIKNNNSKSDTVAAGDGSASTVTQLSTLSQVVTADPSTTVLGVTISNTQSAGSVVETSYVGGSTVVVSVGGNAGAQTSMATVTVSQAAVPETRTQTVYATTYRSTQTITTTLAGGAESTYYSTVTVRRTVTADATGRARMAREKRAAVTW